MLCRLAAAGHRDESHLDEETAATRIQALYRGRQARTKWIQQRRAVKEVEQENRRQMRVTTTPTAMSGNRSTPRSTSMPPMATPSGRSSQSKMSSRLSAGGQMQGESSSLADVTDENATEADANASSTGTPSPMLPSLKASKTFTELPKLAPGLTDYSFMRQDFENQPTGLPKWIQSKRVAVYMLFEEPRSSRGAQVVSLVVLVMILTSIVCFVIETMPELKHVDPDTWLSVEIVCTLSFTIEYLLRLLVCGVSGISMWQFVKNPMNLIDLFAILPFYIWLALRSLKMAKAMGVLRIVRLVRLTRIFKLGRHSTGLRLMAEALKNSSQALWVLSFFLCIGIVLFSSAVYYLEKLGCPDKEPLQAEKLGGDPKSNETEWDGYMRDCRVSKDGKHPTHGLCCDENGAPLDFPSIVEAFWWSLVTMTTVGFGEVYPRTAPGRMVATCTMLSGILLIALPVAIIGRKFQEVYDRKEHVEIVSDDPSIELVGEESRETSDDSLRRDGSTSLQSLHSMIQKELKASASSTGTISEGPSLNEMSRRLRLMKLPDMNMTSLALELAEELDEVRDMQTEIKSMQTEEKARQAEVVEQFDVVLTRFCELVDADIERRPGTGHSSKKAKSNVSSLVAKATKSQAGQSSRSDTSDDSTPRVPSVHAWAPHQQAEETPLPPPSDEPPTHSGAELRSAQDGPLLPGASGTSAED